MKTIIITTILVLVINSGFGQNNTSSSNSYVREKMDLVEATSKTAVPGTILIGTSKSGYKIYLATNRNKSVIVVKDPQGNTVKNERRKQVQTTNGLVCFECMDVSFSCNFFPFRSDPRS